MGKAPSKRKKKRKRSPDRGARAPRKIATEDDVRNIRRMADGIQAARERDPRRYPNPSWEYVRDLYGFGRCTISAILNGTFVPTETRAENSRCRVQGGGRLRPDDQEPMLVTWAKEECDRLNNRTPPAPCYIGDVLTACHAAHPAEMAKLKTLQLKDTTARDSLPAEILTEPGQGGKSVSRNFQAEQNLREVLYRQRWRGRMSSGRCRGSKRPTSRSLRPIWRR